MRKYLLAAIAVLAGSAGPVAEATDFQYGRGVNLVGNHGFYSGSTTWATPAGMNYYLGKGMRVFRIVVAWEWIQPKLGGELDPTVVAALQKETDFLTGAGATVIIDIHNFMRRDLNFDKRPSRPVPEKQVVIGEDPAVPATQFADLWVKIAQKFKSNPKVMFGIMNEPHDVDGPTLGATYNTVLRDIRSTGATNAILLDGLGFAYDLSWTSEKRGTPLGAIVRDPGNNMVIDVHRYFDDYSAGQKETCNRGTGTSILVDSTKWARANKQRLFLGEFAVGRNEACYRELGDMLAYMGRNKDVWTGYTWFGVYAGQQGYNTPDQGFWYSIDPGGPDVQDFTGKTPDDPRMKILLSGP
ncbi:glycoside hydrolase family 5 protein [Neorhizobium sp. NCHU2750]|uniref:glycoside hydrolase family 5 protein n=1 Tax=Neorhizobium sp. NCHU2750 TaxID=1825976 RepID=UPI000E71DB93|nr:cellulase [Neorhizobium sp. NCHU2750]